MLEEGHDAETAKAIAQALMKKLGIRPQQLIEGAYVDLLAGTTEPGAAPKR